jgi:two-component system, NtrC family, sensor kinase
MTNGYDQSMRDRIDRGLRVRAAISGNALGLALLAAAWARGKGFWLVLALVVGHTLYAAVMSKAVSGRVERFIPNLAFSVANTVYGLGILWAFDFVAPAYVTIPLMILFIDGFSEGELGFWVAGMLAAFFVIPLLLGAPFYPVLAMTVAGGIVHWFSEGRAVLLRSALGELSEQAELLRQVNGELGSLHAKMVAQERLSGLGLMAAGVAHEINNPLSYVSSNVGALALDIEDLATNAKLRHEYRDQVIPATLDGLTRVADIVSDLKRFARSDSGKKEIFEVDREVLTAVRVCNGQIKGQCEVSVDVEKQLKVIGQPGQMCQVLINLISNAAYAMRDRGGALRVRAVRQLTEVAITVEDQGHGMPPEVVNRVFEPFFTTKAPGEGTGLGLSVVHGIVRSHGGKIDVSSTEGVGTTFTVRLPLVLQQAPGVAEDHQVTVGNGSAGFAKR